MTHWLVWNCSIIRNLTYTCCVL